MPEGRNARQLRALVEEFATGGVEGALAYVHPEVVWRAPQGWLEQMVYEGHEGVRKLAGYWVGQFEDYGVDLVRVTELEDGRVVALLYQRGGIKQSGAEVEQETGWLTSFEDGLLIEMRAYFSWAEVLEESGLDPAEHLPPAGR